MPKLPKHCPACEATLLVTQLACPRCHTEVHGRFPLDLFAQLPPNDFDFVVLFLKTKGNIKEMERELGISYWTIRSKLTEIVQQLGLEGESYDPQAASSERQAVLEQLNAGQLTVQEAAGLLQKLRADR